MRARVLSPICLAVTILAAGAPEVFSAATVEGTVKLPPAAVTAASTARYQGNLSGLIAPPARPVAVIYLEGASTGAATPTTNISAAIVQEHFQFRPAVLALQTGTSVEFPNLDDTYHNIFSDSKPKRFDLGRYRKDQKPAAVRFDKSGVVKLYCEIHEHMRGTILVLNTPYFTHTDTNGVFRLEHLPAGSFTLKAWLDEKTELRRSVELRDGETVRVDFGNR